MAAVDELLEMLESGNALARIEAAEALGGTSDPRAVEALINALADPEFQVAIAAARALGRCADPRVVEPLVKALDRKDINSIGRAIEFADIVTGALQRLGEPGFQGLLRIVHEHANSEFIGGAAVRALGEIGDWRAVEVLFLALHSPVYEIVQAAASALYGLGEGTLPLFMAALLSPDGDTRQLASETLPKFGAAAIPPLLAALSNGSRAYTREEAAATLSAFDEDERICPALRAALADPAEEVRNAAALALAEIGDDSVVDHILDMPSAFDRHRRSSPLVSVLADFGPPILLPMIRALQDRTRPPHARYRAAFVLAKLGDGRAVTPLISALHDPHPDVQAAAADALGALGDERALPALLEVSQDEHYGARKSAISALGAFERQDAFEMLGRLATDAAEDLQVRLTAVEALRRSGERGLPILRSLALSALSENSQYEVLLKIRAFPILAWLGKPGVDVLIEAAAASDKYTRRLAYSWLEHAQRHSPDSRIIAFLLAALDQEQSPELRTSISFVLARLGELCAVPGLLDALHSSYPLVRAEAARYLGKLGDMAVIPLLHAAYDAAVHADEDQRHVALPGRAEALDAILDAIRRIEARAASDAPSTRHGDIQ